MSSAAKLRKYGRGTATVAAAALVMTSFGPAAFASWEDDPTTNAVEAWPANNTGDQRNFGTIGVVDTGVPVVREDGDGGALDPTPGGNETADENQGAKLVWAGKGNQSIADIRLTLPNRFKAGDIVDLVLTDRSSTEHQNGNTNADAGRAVGFSAIPTVSVDADPKVGNKGGQGWVVDTKGTPTDASDDTYYEAGTQVSADTDAVSPSPVANPDFRVSNTETGAAAWAPDTTSIAQSGDSAAVLAQKAVQRTKPTTAPSFTTEIMPDSGNLGKNRIRLVVKDTASGGDPDGMWVVTLKDLKVDLGANVTPGELRVTPFATSFDANNNSRPSPWFGNNHKEGLGSQISAPMPGASGNDRQISIYTVPAYVSPVTITGENLSIIADGSYQSMGPIVVKETQAYSLGNGAYTVTLDGVVAESTDPSKVKLEVTNGGTTETATVTSITNVGKTEINFTLSGADDTKAATLTLSGLHARAASNTPSPISVTVTGGTINGAANGAANPGGPYWLTPAGLSTLSLPSSANSAAVHSDTWFVQEGANVVTEQNRVDAATITTSNTYTLDLGTPTGGASVSADVAGLTNPVTGTTPLTFAITRQADGSIQAGDIVESNVPTGWTSNAATQVAAAGAAVVVTYTLTADPTKTFTVTIPGASDNATNLAATVPYTGTTQTATARAAGGFVDDGVNQEDILANDAIEQLLLSGVSQAPVNRIGGNNRYETAAKVAYLASGGTLTNPDKAARVILASGENFPDALSASYLSQEMNGAPILLTGKNWLPDDTIKALRDLRAETVYVVGGAAAVSSDVERAVRDLPTYVESNSGEPVAGGTKLSTIRLGGTTRYTTNQLVNMYAAAYDGDATVGKVAYRYGEPLKYTGIFARGDKFPDALAAGVLTAGVDGADPIPLILTEPDSLVDSAVAQIDRLDIQNALVIGSENALSSDVNKALEDKGLSTTRLGGDDRFFTAAAIDEFAMRGKTASTVNPYPGLGFLDYDASGKISPANQINSAFLANGLKFPDALTAAPWIGREEQVLNLVQPDALTDGTTDFLTKRASDIQKAIGLGLGDAVSTKVVSSANAIVSSK